MPEPARYRGAVAAALVELGFADTGVAVWLVRPGEQQAVAEVLVAEEPTRVALGLGALVAAMDRGEPPARAVVPGLPAGGGGELRALNNRRDWTKRHGLSVLLVLDEAEVVRLQAEAPDTWSGLSVTRRVAFEPDLATDPARAAEALLTWTRRSWGRLDLRGLVRSEGEDVAWEVGEVYQDLTLHATVHTTLGPTAWSYPAWQVVAAAGHVLWAGTAVAGVRRPLVLRGPPGSGKTFFLRWLAVRPRALGAPAGVGLQRPFHLLAPVTALRLGEGPNPLVEALVDWLVEARQPFAHLLAAALGRGEVLVLLDGLDELPSVEARRRMAQAVAELHAASPGCPVLVSSRVVGYDEAPVPGADLADVQPFAPEQIRGFLGRWCARYAQDRAGTGAEADGRAEGEALAEDVLASPALLRLAANPLMLTILAIVHRTGLRLPDHRVELYGHVTRVLVERWNRVRSLRPTPRGGPPAPLVRLADALRLLGPLALQLVRSGGRSSIPEDRLLVLLSEVMAQGAFRGWGSPAEVLRLFQRELGLLVESGPGTWSFLHLTLVEHLAALELLRTDGLDALLKDPTEVYQPRWREVLLLAAGELAVVRAEDERADRLVRGLVAAAKRRVGRPSGVVPSVLGGLLADDPQLRPDTAELLVRTLVPDWWFDRAYGRDAVRVVFAEAAQLIPGQIAAGPHGDRLRSALHAEYAEPGPRKRDRLLATLRRVQPSVAASLLRALVSAGVDPGPLVLRCLEDTKAEEVVRNARWLAGGFEVRDGAVYAWFLGSRWLDARVRAGLEPLELRTWVPAGDRGSGRRLLSLDWSAFTVSPAVEAALVRIDGPLPGISPDALGAASGPLVASVRRARAPRRRPGS